MKQLLVLAVLACAVVAGFKTAPVVAESLIQAAENASTIARDRVVDGSAYLAGESIDVQGTVKGDLYCAGQTVTINGTIDGDVLCAGQTVTISGTVHGDVRAAGMNVTLKATIDGSVTLAAATVTTDSASIIGRDATLTAGTIDLSGRVARDAMLASQTVVLNGSIDRDARIAAETISASSTAKIGRNLVYESSNEARLPSGVVAGTVQRTTEREQRPVVSITAADILTGLVLAVLMFSVLTVAVVLAAPRYVHRVSDISGAKQFASYFLVGLVAFVVTPVLLLILLVTVVGIYAAIVLMIAMTLAILIGASLVAYRLGRFMLAGKQSVFMSALVGSLALGALGSIPFVGWVSMFISALAGLGMILLGLRTQYVTEVLTAASPVKRSKRSS